jgi:hypothetical protein
LVARAEAVDPTQVDVVARRSEDEGVSLRFLETLSSTSFQSGDAGGGEGRNRALSHRSIGTEKKRATMAPRSHVPRSSGTYQRKPNFRAPPVPRKRRTSANTTNMCVRYTS